MHNFSQVFGPEKTAFDEKFFIRALEFVALIGTRFFVLRKKSQWIVQVECEDYPSSCELFVDTRFLSNDPSIQKKPMPTRDEMLRHLKGLEGALYVWGGNVSSGIPELMELYPPSSQLTVFERNYRSFFGVDCSGLLYEISNGHVPRNTSELLHFGSIVDRNNLQPLDLIVWPGHVLIALDETRVIESREKDGVVISNMQERLNEIERTREFSTSITNSEKKYMIKRWITY